VTRRHTSGPGQLKVVRRFFPVTRHTPDATFTYKPDFTQKGELFVGSVRQ
jgi:hypothetical protein